MNRLLVELCRDLAFGRSSCTSLVLIVSKNPKSEDLASTQAIDTTNELNSVLKMNMALLKEPRKDCSTYTP